MLTLVSEVLVAADPERVWSVLTDVASWPRWCRPVVRVIAASDLVVGGRLSYVLRMGPGIPVTFDVTLDEVVPPERLCWSSSKWWGVHGTRCFVLTADRAGTRVADHKTFDSPIWPVSIAYPRSSVRRMSEAWLSDLRDEVDRRRR